MMPFSGRWGIRLARSTPKVVASTAPTQGFFQSANLLMESQRVLAMAAPLAFSLLTRKQLTNGMQQVWRMAAQLVKILPGREAAHTLPTFVILLETKFAHYIVWGSPLDWTTAKPSFLI